MQLRSISRIPYMSKSNKRSRLDLFASSLFLFLMESANLLCRFAKKLKFLRTKFLNLRGNLDSANKTVFCRASDRRNFWVFLVEDYCQKKFQFASSFIILYLNRRTFSRFFLTQKSPKSWYLILNWSFAEKSNSLPIGLEKRNLIVANFLIVIFITLWKGFHNAKISEVSFPFR